MADVGLRSPLWPFSGQENVIEKKNNSHTTGNSQGIKHRGLEASLIEILMYGAGGVGQ